MTRVALLPARLIALDGTGERRDFTLAVRWDGDVMVRPGRHATRWPDQGSVAVVAPERCLRRRFSLRPRGREELRAQAADLFPFDLAEAALALHQHQEGCDVCVLAEEDLARLDGAVAILVAEPTPPAIAAALKQRLAHGAVFDFAPVVPVLLGPAVLFGVLHLALLVTILAGTLAVVLTGQSAERQALRAEAVRLQGEAQPLSQRLKAIAIMRREVVELARFAHRPGADLAPRLGALVADMPPGTLIDRIGYKDGQMSFTGLGNEAAGWLRRNGAADGEVQITDLAKTDRFTVTRSLSSP